MLVRVRLIQNMALGVLAFAIVLGLIFLVGFALVLNLYWPVAALVLWGVIVRQAREIDKLRHDIAQLRRVIDEELERTEG
jgi:uncharacterized membrane protein